MDLARKRKKQNKKIIKTGNLRFETNDLEVYITQIQNAVKIVKQQLKKRQ
jgi:hypothetical protein